MQVGKTVQGESVRMHAMHASRCRCLALHSSRMRQKLGASSSCRSCERRLGPHQGRTRTKASPFRGSGIAMFFSEVIHSPYTGRRRREQRQ